MVIPMTLFPYTFARISLSNFSEWSKAFPSLTCFLFSKRVGQGERQKKVQRHCCARFVVMYEASLPFRVEFTLNSSPLPSLFTPCKKLFLINGPALTQFVFLIIYGMC